MPHAAAAPTPSIELPRSRTARVSPLVLTLAIRESRRSGHPPTSGRAGGTEVPWPPDRAPRWLRRYLLVEVQLPDPAARRTPSPFREGSADVPSCLPVQAVLAALHAAGDAPHGWTVPGVPGPVHRFSKPGGRVDVAVRPGSFGEPPLPAARPWRLASELCDLDADVLLAVLARALDRGAQLADGSVWIAADALLDDRGIRPKTTRAAVAVYSAGHREVDRERIRASMARLDALWLDLRDVLLRVSTPAGRTRPVRQSLEAKLLLFLERRARDGAAWAWRVRPGRWLDPFLASPNRQTARLDRQVLRFDPYRERWEKRLGYYLTFHLRMDARRSRPLVRRIGTLLDALRLPSDLRHPERTRARFEAALERLVSVGVIGGWGYTTEALATLQALPARHCADLWRRTTVQVTPTAALTARYRSLRRT